MTRVSSNAGKDPYRRTDFNLFKKLNEKNKSPYINITNIKARFDCIFKTDYNDKKNKRLYYKDLVSYMDKTYQIGYDSINYYWCLIDKENPQNTLKLGDVHKNCEFLKQSEVNCV